MVFCWYFSKISFFFWLALTRSSVIQLLSSTFRSSKCTVIAYWLIRSKILCWNSFSIFFLFCFLPLFSIWARFCLFVRCYIVFFQVERPLFYNFFYIFHLPMFFSICHSSCRKKLNVSIMAVILVVLVLVELSFFLA